MKTIEATLHKKWSFPLRISSVNKTKSAGYLLKKSLIKNFLCSARAVKIVSKQIEKNNFSWQLRFYADEAK